MRQDKDSASKGKHSETYGERVSEHISLQSRGGVLPYLGYIGMCGPKGYGFSAVLVINWVSILVILPPF